MLKMNLELREDTEMTSSHCNYKGGPYRSRKGAIFGVCRGLAEYFDFSVGWTRALIVIAFLCTGIWPVGIGYVIAALLMKPEPVLPLRTEADAEFYSSYAGHRTMARRRLGRVYESLDRRLQRLESAVTSKDFDWDHRLNNG